MPRPQQLEDRDEKVRKGSRANMPICWADNATVGNRGLIHSAALQTAVGSSHTTE